MPRPMSANFLSAVTSKMLRPALFVDATFMTGMIHVWSGTGSITWGGNTYQGLGALGSITVIEDGATVEARGVTLNLSGIINSLLADVLQELQLGAPVVISLGLFDESLNLIADPVVAWAGRMDQPTIEIGGDTALLSINCENRLIDMNVAVNRRYTQDDQQMDFPGDLGFQFVNSLQNQAVFWGSSPTGSNQ